MAATIANVDAALKNDYQPVIREQLRNKWMLLSQLSKNTKDVQGRYAVLSLHTGRNSGVGARAAGAQLPTAGSQSYREERVPVARNYARVQIHGDLIAASASDKGSFARMLDREIKGAVTDLKNDVSRQLFNDSTKSIAQCGTTSAANVVVLTDPTAIQLKQFHVGMVVDIGTTGNTTDVASARNITAVDRSGGTITIDGAAVTTDSSDYIFRSGSDRNELTGLREIVAGSGTLFNVDPSVEPEWVSTVSTNGSTRTPTELIFETAIEDVNFESGEDPNMLVTTRGVRRGFAATLQSLKRFTNTVEVKGGFSAVTVQAGNVELPLVVDNDCPAETAFAINTDHLCEYTMGDSWSWMDRDGTVLKYVHDYDAYEAVLYNYHELMTDKRSAHAVIEALTES